MQSFIRFVLRFDLDCSFFLIIPHEVWGIMDERTLDRATRFLPWLIIVVELESYEENDHFINE